jgi:hypothetical protein
MMAVLIVPLILTFSPAAVWALRAGGLRRLWALYGLMLLSILFLAIVVSIKYSVPSSARVALYFLAFCGPSILLATSALSITMSSRGHLRANSRLPSSEVSLGLRLALLSSYTGCGYGNHERKSFRV